MTKKLIDNPQIYEVAMDPKTVAHRDDEIKRAYAGLVSAQAALVASVVMRMPSESPEIIALNEATANLRRVLEG